MTAVVATRDRPRLLADALASVAAQRRPPLEMRIGDDGDADLSDALAALGGIEATVVRTGAAGAGTARNRAAAGARGDALAFLDDDDRWLPEHLQGLAAALADPAVALAFGDCAVVREELGPEGTRAERARRVIAHDWDAALMRHDDFIPSHAAPLRYVLLRPPGDVPRSSGLSLLDCLKSES